MPSFISSPVSWQSNLQIFCGCRRRFNASTFVFFDIKKGKSQIKSQVSCAIQREGEELISGIESKHVKKSSIIYFIETAHDNLTEKYSLSSLSRPVYKYFLNSITSI